MPFERKPMHHDLEGVRHAGPLPRSYKPPGGHPYPVVLGDNWKKLAFRWGVDAGDLIFFNFRTRNTDEVNWYLRWHVGCRLPTKDMKNWEFSNDLKPGIIYRPPPQPPRPKLVFNDGIEDFNDRVGSGTDLGNAINKAEHSHHGVHSWHWRLDVAHFGLMALEIAAAHLVEFGIGGAVAAVVGGPLMGVLNFMNLGMGHMDAIDSIKTDRARRGAAHGIILGAAQESRSFIRSEFVFKSEEYGVQYKEQNKNFQNVYLFFLMRGVQLGGKLSRREKRLLFEQLDTYPQALANPGGFYADRYRKKESERVDYYRLAAAKLRAKSGAD